MLLKPSKIIDNHPRLCHACEILVSPHAPMAVCAGCGKLFPKKVPTSKYCSNQCKLSPMGNMDKRMAAAKQLEKAIEEIRRQLK